MPLGSNESVRVDVRILAATNADLKKLVDDGKFREDLYYRLNVINLELPPLRERKEDIPLLIEHFFTRFCRENEKFLDAEQRSILRFEPDAMQILMEHNWPGNVRELENVVERAVVLTAVALVPHMCCPIICSKRAGSKFRGTPVEAWRLTLRYLRLWPILSGGRLSKPWTFATTVKRKRPKHCVFRCRP